jgi:cytochrome c553
MKNVRRLLSHCLVVAGIALSCAAQAQNEAIPAFKTVDSMEARVQGCVTCHGQSGQGTNVSYFPRIAGKPAGYLYNQLVAFRDGTRRYAPMNYLLAYLPDAYLRDMAEHFAKQTPAYVQHDAGVVQPGLLARGQAIVTQGDKEKTVPACIACHGEKLAGMEPGIPGLVGLRPAYIAAQLTRWRVGERRAIEPDCMKRVASHLTDRDIAAVAAWLGQQTPSQGAAPESSNLVRMPFACGSQK